MSGPQKVYVIDPVKAKSGASRPAAGDLPAYLQSSAGGETRRSAPSSRGGRASGVPLILSYMAGPLSILATAAGRGSRAWTAISLLGAGSAVATAWLWSRLPWHRAGFHAVVGAIALAAAAVSLCCAAWTRHIVSAGRREAPRIRRSPGWLRSSAAAGFLGTIVPGMGLFVTGHPARAAAAVWAAGLAGLAAAVVSKAGRLWDLNRVAGSFAVDPVILERILIVAAGVAVAGAVAWIVQILDGIRLAGDRPNPVPRGSVFSLALVAALVLMAATFDASVVAGALDRGAEATATRGMREIPFYLARTASALDPSRPAYACRAIKMGERYGKRDFVERERRELLLRLEPAVALLEEAGIVAAGSGAAAGDTGPALASAAWRNVTASRPPVEILLHGTGYTGMMP